ncbi:hypothetical protein FJZ53_06890 [Candidatus Woesearchaeota archaeon]|nr:hypothetical protein [Candidatus Woesearchaeota archaeon]
MDFITILGLTAATITTASFLPQVIKTLKTRQTKDLSLGMYLAMVVGFSLWLIYGLLVKDIPIISANAIGTTLALIILVLKIKHG